MTRKRPREPSSGLVCVGVEVEAGAVGGGMARGGSAERERVESKQRKEQTAEERKDSTSPIGYLRPPSLPRGV